MIHVKGILVLTSLASSALLSGPNSFRSVKSPVSTPTDDKDVKSPDKDLNSFFFGCQNPPLTKILRRSCVGGQCREKTPKDGVSELLGRLDNRNTRDSKILLARIARGIDLLAKKDKSLLSKEFIEESYAILERTNENVKLTTEYHDVLVTLGVNHDLPKKI